MCVWCRCVCLGIAPVSVPPLFPRSQHVPVAEGHACPAPDSRGYYQTHNAPRRSPSDHVGPSPFVLAPARPINHLAPLSRDRSSVVCRLKPTGSRAQSQSALGRQYVVQTDERTDVHQAGTLSYYLPLYSFSIGLKNKVSLPLSRGLVWSVCGV